MESIAVVRAYLDALVGHDWSALRQTLAAEVVRIGPYRDEYRGRDEYVAFLSALLPTLPGYSMRVDRVTGTGSVVVVELSETVTIDGQPVETPEAIVFEVAAGRIAHVAVYIQSQPPA